MMNWTLLHDEFDIKIYVSQLFDADIENEQMIDAEIESIKMNEFPPHGYTWCSCEHDCCGCICGIELDVHHTSCHMFITKTISYNV